MYHEVVYREVLLYYVPLTWLISFMNKLHDIESCLVNIAQYDAEIFIKQRF